MAKYMFTFIYLTIISFHYYSLNLGIIWELFPLSYLFDNCSPWLFGK